MKDSLELAADTGGQLFLFDITTAEETFFLSADTYLAERDYPANTIFRKDANAPFYLTVKQPLHEGLHSFPGDKENFGRLAESALFFLTEVNHADEKSRT